MIKKITAFVLILLFSCNYNNLDNIKKVVIEDKKEIMESSINFPYKNNLDKLKKLFKENNITSFNQVYFDDNNNGMIIFGDKIYILDKELNIVKTSPLYKEGESCSCVYSFPIIDKNGNGVIFYSPLIVGSFTNSSIKKLENFIPTENKIIDSDKIIPNINTQSYNNFKGMGYSIYNNEKELRLSDIESFFNYKTIRTFKLDNKEKFNSVILNKNNDGIVITKEEDEYHNLTFRYYILKNNELDLKNGKIIEHNFEKATNYYIEGKIDDKGNGSIYVYPSSKTMFQILEISNFEIKKEIFTFKEILSLYKNLDNSGNGFIISRDSNEYVYFNKINKFKIASSYKLFKEKDNFVRYYINSNGTGFISSSRTIYKNNAPSNYNDYKIDNEIFFIFENNIIN